MLNGSRMADRIYEADFRLPAKICKRSLASSAYIYSNKEVSPKAMNWLLVLGTPFGVFNRVEKAMHRLTYASTYLALAD